MLWVQMRSKGQTFQEPQVMQGPRRWTKLCGLQWPYSPTIIMVILSLLLPKRKVLSRIQSVTLKYQSGVKKNFFFYYLLSHVILKSICLADLTTYLTYTEAKFDPILIHIHTLFTKQSHMLWLSLTKGNMKRKMLFFLISFFFGRHYFKINTK